MNQPFAGWPKVQSLTYIAASAAIYEGSYRFNRLLLDDKFYVNHLMHVTAHPFIVLLSEKYRPRREQEQARASFKRQVLAAGAGAALSVAAYGTIVAFMAHKGWVKAPQWGWQVYGQRPVAAALVFQTIVHGCVAYNEEELYRGVGRDLHTAAFGQAGNVLALAIFSVLHYPHTLVAHISYPLVGMLLTELRLLSNTLAMPIGYHWSWNLLQAGILGYDQPHPSLRPLHIHGPETWVGTPMPIYNHKSPETG